ADDLDADMHATREGPCRNPARSRMTEVVASDFRRDETCSIGNVRSGSGLGGNRADSIAHHCERCLVEDEHRVETAKPLLDQKRLHFVTVTLVPAPTVESSSNASTRRLLPERPRPIERAVLYPPDSTRGTSAMPGPVSTKAMRIPARMPSETSSIVALP